MMNKILIIKTGLYSDGHLIEGLLLDNQASEVESIELQPTAMNSVDWDAVAEKILQAEKVVVV